MPVAASVSKQTREAFTVDPPAATRFVAMPPKFSMTKCAKPTKRGLENATQSASKLPRAGDVVVDAVIPKVSSSTRAASAPVICCIYKWSSNAGDILPEYADKQAVGLYQTRA